MQKLSDKDVNPTDNVDQTQEQPKETKPEQKPKPTSSKFEDYTRKYDDINDDDESGIVIEEVFD